MMNCENHGLRKGKPALSLHFLVYEREMVARSQVPGMSGTFEISKGKEESLPQKLLLRTRNGALCKRNEVAFPEGPHKEQENRQETGFCCC